MFAVVVVAVVIALKIRRDQFISLATHYAKKEELTLGTADAVGSAEKLEDGHRGSPDVEAAREDTIIARDRARAAWHERLRLTYERAARYPWLPGPPDPPEPE